MRHYHIALLCLSGVAWPVSAVPSSHFGLTGKWIVYRNDGFEGIGGQGPPVSTSLENDPLIIGTKLFIDDKLITWHGRSSENEFHNGDCRSPDVTVSQLNHRINQVQPGTGQKLNPKLFEGKDYSYSLSIECKDGHFGPKDYETIYPITQNRFIILWYDGLILKFRRMK